MIYDKLGREVEIVAFNRRLSEVLVRRVSDGTKRLVGLYDLTADVGSGEIRAAILRVEAEQRKKGKQ